MKRYSPDRLLAGMAAALTLGGLVVCSSAAGASVTETSRVGQTTAVLSYERLGATSTSTSLPAFRSSPIPVYYGNFEVTVSRGGRRLVTDGLRPTCRKCTISPGGRARSVRVLDVSGDSEPEVIVDLNTYNLRPEANAYDAAETYYNSYVYSYVAELNGGTGGYRRVEGRFGGHVKYRLRDLEGDGSLEFVTKDDRFAMDFSSVSGRPFDYDLSTARFPLRVWRVGHRRFENVTKRYPRTIARHARRAWRSYLRLRRAHQPGDGALAAYAADLYLLGRGQVGWKRLRRLARPDLRYPNEVGVDAQGRDGESWQGYLLFLRQILRRTGYAAGASTADAAPGCKSRLVVITKRKAVSCVRAKRIFANWARDVWPEDNRFFDCFVTSRVGTAGTCENDALPHSRRFRWRMR